MADNEQSRYEEERKYLKMLLKTARDNWLEHDEYGRALYGAEIEDLQNRIDMLEKEKEASA